MRTKARILRVGRVDRNWDGTFTFTGWGMDGRGECAMLEYGPDGFAYFMGWSVEELEEIMQRPSEFLEIEP